MYPPELGSAPSRLQVTDGLLGCIVSDAAQLAWSGESHPPCSDAKVANRDGCDFGWEIAHMVTRRPPIPLYASHEVHALTLARRDGGVI